MPRGLDLDDLVIVADEVVTRGRAPGSASHGAREPEVNAPVHARDVGWLAEGDLVWRAQRVIGGYQGAVHGGIPEPSYDADRNGLLRDEGWQVLELYSDDVFRAPPRRETVTRFALAMGLTPATLHIT